MNIVATTPRLPRHIETFEDYERLTSGEDRDRLNDVINGNDPTIISFGAPFGWPVMFCKQRDGNWIIGAGCRWLTINGGVAHWRNRRETMRVGSASSRRACGMLDLIFFVDTHVDEYHARDEAQTKIDHEE